MSYDPLAAMDAQMQYFRLEEAARRYAVFRPKVHDIVLDWLSDCRADGPFHKAIDIACGTGDSTVPLARIANEVVGIDSSRCSIGLSQKSGIFEMPISRM